MATAHRATLATIKRFDQLIAYLRDEMGWPIARNSFEDVDDLFFDFTPDELGIESKIAAKIQEIKRLRPLSAKQPWGIFFIKFEPKKLPVVALRRILSQVALKKRASSNSAERAAWAADDLLFISNYGEGEERQISFAHFSRAPDGHDLPTLKVLGWDNRDTVLHLDAAVRELTGHLAWPDDEADVDTWRARWRTAFTLRHQEVVTTSRELSIRLAELARAIRDRIKTALDIETEKGPLTKLLKAFQTTLVHDLDANGFADMYAQTIAYGLLSARIADPHKRTIDDFAAHMRTNPFLRELMETFLKVGGRHGKAGGPGIDFDELGVSEVIKLLDDANMEAVVRDFGDRNPQEDPVIHFYELFLKEYDAKKRMQRGVFYTPRPVVSYIVRSVDEMLRSEFGLGDGLADTTTWGQMVSRYPDLNIPTGISPDQDFVQILDPATGTGTFLVEVVEQIHKTLLAKWKAQGCDNNKIKTLWNEYVSKHLLTRLHGYELLMAPYAIAHLKIGLKLYETGYSFGSDERARIYLTNTLEPAQDYSDRFEFVIPALAHEAAAVNVTKRNKCFTVILGNPPYSKITSNLTPEMRAIVDRYRYLDGKKIKERGALQFEINLQDDYVKFFRFCEERINSATVGVVGLITNNGYLSTPTLRGMRDSLIESFSSIWVLDLHGHIARGEVGPDGTQEENVFDIVQGVSLFLGCRKSLQNSDGSVFHSEHYGSQTAKYALLQSSSLNSTHFSNIAPAAPFYLFIPHQADLALEWSRHVGLSDLFPRNSAGIITARDGLVIAESEKVLADRLERFSQAKSSDEAIYDKFGFSPSKRFDLRAAQSEIRRLKSFSEPIRKLLHRPFDERFIFFHSSVVWSLSRPMAEQMKVGRNLALVATRQVTRPQFEHAFVSRHMIEIKACSHDRNTQIFPLFIYNSDDELELATGVAPNLNPTLFAKFASAVGLKPCASADEQNKSICLSPLQLFNFSYAILYCQSYRDRYFEFLRSDFPRLPLTGRLELFRELTRLGSELVSLHLLESTAVERPIAAFVGDQNAEVEKISWSRNTVWIDKAQSVGFSGVLEKVWDFHIGGYQVCEKWLKDRKGRSLSKDDVTRYQKIVAAISETIRLMAEIDEVIDCHGGWPGAFAYEDRPVELLTPGVKRGLELKEGLSVANDFDVVPPTVLQAAEEPAEAPVSQASRIKEEADGSFPEFGRSEIVLQIRSSFNSREGLDREELLRRLSDTFGFKRLGPKIRKEIEGALQAAARRSIIQTVDGLVKIEKHTIEDYSREEAKVQFLASLEGRVWIERDEAIRNFARWLGFRRTGEAISDTARSLINGLIREGRLETNASLIRRSG